MTKKMRHESVDYAKWRETVVSLGNGSYRVATKAGMAQINPSDPSTILLASEIDLTSTDHFLSLNCGPGLLGAIAAGQVPEEQMTLADSNIISVAAAQRTLKSNGQLAVNVYCSDGVSHLPNLEPADVVAIRLPKGKRPALQLIWDGFHALKAGGDLYLAGANDEGIKSYVRHMNDLFGNCVIRNYKRGCRVALSVKPDLPPPTPKSFCEPWLDHAYTEEFEVDILNNRYTVHSRPGIFSWDRLDAGTTALLRSMKIKPSDHILDLGCGYGIVGAIAGSKAKDGSVTLVDVDIRAVEAAKATVTANKLENCEVLLSDCGAAIKDRTFDVVLSNVPFHHGKSTQYDAAFQFMNDAAALLQPGGRFYLVPFNSWHTKSTYSDCSSGSSRSITMGNSRCCWLSSDRHRVIQNRNPYLDAKFRDFAGRTLLYLRFLAA